MTKPKLSIICLTYNHAGFIRQALDGFVMQKTNFAFEVIIHDDASTDGTTEIIKEYAQKYPDIIKPIYQTQNQWSKGINVSKKFIYPQIRGQYVALNEGDDYWTDENKLQRQVDFLDTHPDYSVCFHPVLVHWDDNLEPDTIFPKKKMLKDMSFQGLLKCNFIQTNSVVYRWRFHHDDMGLIPDGILPGDWFLHLLHAQVGKIGYINEVMSVYRRNSGGIWTGVGSSPAWYDKCLLANLKFNKCFEQQFKVDKLMAMVNIARKGIDIFLQSNNFERLKDLADKYPDIYAKALQYNTFANKKYKLLGLNLLEIRCNLSKNRKRFLLFGCVPIGEIKLG